MQNSGPPISTRLVTPAAVLLLVVALVLKYPFIDWYHERTFTPDSEITLEHTRAYYFFIKNPSINAPLKLSAYPTYFPGALVMAAFTANILGKLIEWGILDLPLQGSDNSLILISMRISNWILTALSVPLLFLTLTLITPRTLLAFMLTAGYFMFNNQQMNVDLVRVEHYLLCAFVFLMYASAYMLRYPHKTKSYLLLGAACALILPTKLNAPMYLLSALYVLGWLLVTHSFSVKKFLLGLIPFMVLCFVFFIQWVLYASEIVPTVTEILNVGAEWIAYWSIRPYGYYNYDQFFNGTTDARVFVFLGLVFISSVVAGISFIMSCNRFAGWLLMLLTFFTVYGIFIPVVARYGIFYPVLYVLVIGYALNFLLVNFQNDRLRQGIKTTTAIAIAITFSFYAQAYVGHVKMLKHQDIATLEVRKGIADWMGVHIPKGSKVLTYHPRVNNPPIYDLPYIFLEDILNFQFLHPDSMLYQRPPDKALLMAHCNAVLIHSEYYAYHLHTLEQFHPNDSLGTATDLYYNLEDILAKMWIEGIGFGEAALKTYAPQIDREDVMYQIQEFGQHYVGTDVFEWRFQHLVSKLPPTCNLAIWKAFYGGLRSFPATTFSSQYYTYGSNWMTVYVLSDEPLSYPLPEVELLTASGQVLSAEDPLVFRVTNMLNVPCQTFQLQFFTDSSMRWPIGPNIDGFVNRYSHHLQPISNTDSNVLRWVPLPIRKPLLENGSIKIKNKVFAITGPESANTHNMAHLFKSLAYSMYHTGKTFEQANTEPQLSGILMQFAQIDPNEFTFDQYLEAFGIEKPLSEEDFKQEQRFTLVPNYLKPGKTYFWRVRLKYQEQAYSEWSETGKFILAK